MKKKKLLSFLVILFIPLLFLFKPSRHKSPIYCKYANEITGPFSTYLRKNYNLYYYGGGGGFLENVKIISLHYKTIKQLPIDDARVLFITCVEELLKRINENEKIRPYLEHYPFTEKGLEFSISLYDENKERVPPSFPAYVSLINKKIYYAYYDYETDMLKDLYSEPYQEALSIVKKETH
jgi:hypothetical protein